MGMLPHLSGMRKRRIASAPGLRICNRCDRELPATPELFVRDLSRPLGLAYECRECMSARKKGRDRRRERWTNMTAEQKARKMALSRRYYRTNNGRAIFLLKSCQSFDKKRGLHCDLTKQWLLDNIIGKACTYCGTSDEGIGCDRIDNSLGHAIANVVPCCGLCNRTRSNHFTPDEMRLLGKTIEEIRRLRGTASMAVANEARRGS